MKAAPRLSKNVAAVPRRIHHPARVATNAARAASVTKAVPVGSPVAMVIKLAASN